MAGLVGDGSSLVSAPLSKTESAHQGEHASIPTAFPWPSRHAYFKQAKEGSKEVHPPS